MHLLALVREECNKYDLTTAPFFDWPIIMIGPGGLLSVVPHLFVVPISVHLGSHLDLFFNTMFDGYAQKSIPAKH